MGEGLGFGGEAAGFYHRYRRGYPSAVIDALIGAFGLTGDDVVIDLGCGTGVRMLGVDTDVEPLSRGSRSSFCQ